MENLSRNILSEIQVETIRKNAEDLRRSQGFMEEAPIANDIYTILDQLKIILLEYPICSDTGQEAFSASLLYTEIEDKEIVCLGVNTCDYFDRQIFAIAHELYHYLTKTGSHLSRLSEELEQDDSVETMANRFAAEFLLPENTLKSLVLDEFSNSSLEHIAMKALLRFIARLQCTWWLPYKALVKRLGEINAISQEQYTLLYANDGRNMDGDYGRIGKATHLDVFTKLNTITRATGTSPKNIEIIIRNFEDGFIGENSFQAALNLFNKSPEDFGFKIEVSDEDIADFSDIIGEAHTSDR